MEVTTEIVRVGYEYYTYSHVEGWGSDDHMAGEIIARACRKLGYRAANKDIERSVGMRMSFPITANCRRWCRAGEKAEMQWALQWARSEVRISDCKILVVKRREVTVLENCTWKVAGFDCGESKRYRCLQERRDGKWVELQRIEVE